MLKMLKPIRYRDVLGSVQSADASHSSAAMRASGGSAITLAEPTAAPNSYACPGGWTCSDGNQADAGTCLRYGCIPTGDGGK